MFIKERAYGEIKVQLTNLLELTNQGIMNQENSQSKFFEIRSNLFKLTSVIEENIEVEAEGDGA